MTKRTLKNHEYAQAHVREYDDGSVALVSYTTLVIKIDPDGWMGCSGLYSKTTRKHIGYFAHEYGFNFQNAKRCVEDGKIYNIHTGEYKDIWA